MCFGFTRFVGTVKVTLHSVLPTTTTISVSLVIVDGNRISIGATVLLSTFTAFGAIKKVSKSVFSTSSSTLEVFFFLCGGGGDGFLALEFIGQESKELGAPATPIGVGIVGVAKKDEGVAAASGVSLKVTLLFLKIEVGVAGVDAVAFSTWRWRRGDGFSG